MSVHGYTHGMGSGCESNGHEYKPHRSPNSYGSPDHGVSMGWIRNKVSGASATNERRGQFAGKMDESAQKSFIKSARSGNKDSSMGRKRLTAGVAAQSAAAERGSTGKGSAFQKGYSKGRGR